MKKHILAMMITSALLAACGEARNSEPNSQQSAAVAAAEMPSTSEPTAATSSEPAYFPEIDEQVIENKAIPTNEVITHTAPTQRLFAITAHLRFRTDDVRKTAIAIEQLVTQMGGFVIANETTSDIRDTDIYKQADGMVLEIERYVSSTHLSVRIPREKATDFLHALQPHISFLSDQNYQAEDIFAKMQRERLTAQREQEKAQSLSKLNQQATPKSANHADKQSTIESQFAAREREDEAKIQALELKDQVDFARIELDFEQPENVMKSVRVDSKALAAQHRPPVWASVVQAFDISLQILFELALFLLKTWFVWLGLTAAVILYRQNQRKKSSSNNKS